MPVCGHSSCFCCWALFVGWFVEALGSWLESADASEKADSASVFDSATVFLTSFSLLANLMVFRHKDAGKDPRKHAIAALGDVLNLIKSQEVKAPMAVPEWIWKDMNCLLALFIFSVELSRLHILRDSITVKILCDYKHQEAEAATASSGGASAGTGAEASIALSVLCVCLRVLVCLFVGL